MENPVVNKVEERLTNNDQERVNELEDKQEDEPILNLAV